MDGTLAIMVGANPEVFDAVRPVLATMGTDIVRCGGPGAGQVVKLMNNMVLFQTVVALAEAIAAAEGAGDSFALRNHGRKGLLPQSYSEQALSLRYAAKDLSYALELSATLTQRQDLREGDEVLVGVKTEDIVILDEDRDMPA